MTMLATLIQEAKADYRKGRKQDAQQKLRQAIQLEPTNHKLWLALAKTAVSEKETLAILTEAEHALPHHPDIKRAKQALERQQTRRLQTQAIYATVALLAMGVITAVFFLLNQPTKQPQPVALALAAPIQITASPAPTDTPTPNQFSAKQVAQQSEPRATWTVTPTPSPTPTPTPTVIPTFVSSYSYTQYTRPFGVNNNEKWIDVNLSTQTLIAYEGDQAVFSTLISSGLPAYETVTGQFRIWYRVRSQTMDGRRLGYDYVVENVPHVMYFYQDYAIHGAYWHNNFGSPMSHGCVNVHPDEANWLYDWASLGTMVNVHY